MNLPLAVNLLAGYTLAVHIEIFLRVLGNLIGSHHDRPFGRYRDHRLRHLDRWPIDERAGYSGC